MSWKEAASYLSTAFVRPSYIILLVWIDNKKVTPISECFKVPKEVCGAKECSLIPGPEQCHDEVKTIIEKVSFNW